MTEEQKWIDSASPASLWYQTEHLPSRRKLRTKRRILLFGCGCYRLVWDRIELRGIKEAIEKAEEFADGVVTREELCHHRYPHGNPQRETSDWYLMLYFQALLAAHVVPSHVAWTVRAAFHPEKQERADKWEDCLPQANLVRDILGNPFRSISFDVSWRTSTVVAIARQIYESRDFSAMPILADALQDAGCASGDILDHCRAANGVHVRGCWVLDLVLDKS